MKMRTSFAQLLRSGGNALQEYSPSPMLDTRVLLRWAARASDQRLITEPDTAPGLLAQARFRHALRRRRNGESVAVITRNKEFFGLAFRISRAVLAPRPETELLVERALALLEPASARRHRIAELGTGCGAIAIALARECPHCEIIATDCSRRALALARTNAARLHASHIRWRRASWYAGLSNGNKFDLIISNPPYVSDDDPCLNDQGLRHEPRRALAAGADGLAALRILIAGAPRHLAGGGKLLLEHGATQGEAVRALMQDAGLQEIRTYRDLANHERASVGTAPDITDRIRQNRTNTTPPTPPTSSTQDHP